MWTGDVYKVVPVLRRHRPDLILLPVGTEPTGLLLVLGLDPDSRVLDERYDDILRETVMPDPQEIAPEVLERRGALDPEAVLAASFWSLLREARAEETPAGPGLRRLRRQIRRELGADVIASRAPRLAALRS
jgi:hypothetical protein